MDLLPIDEAANILGVSVETLRKMRFRNRGPLSYLYNGKVGYRIEDLEQWRAEQLESGKRGGNSHVHAWTAVSFCAPGERIDRDGYKPTICKIEGEFVTSDECPEHGDGPA